MRHPVANRPRPADTFDAYPSSAAVDDGGELDRVLAACRFRLVLLRAWEGPPGWRLGGRREPTVLFLHLGSGRVAVQLGDRQETLAMGPGDLLLVSEGVAVDAWALGGEPVPHACGRLSMRVHGGIDGCALLGLGGIHAGDDRIAALLVEMVRERTRQPPGWQAGGDAAVTALMLHLLRRRPPSLGSSAAVAWSDLRRCRPALDLVERRFSDPDLRVGDLAGAVALSEVALRSLCRRALGIAPADLIRRRRLEEACLLLAEEDLPIKAIAARCGFSDPSFFCRSFRRLTGCTAVTYRQGARRG